MAATGDEPFYEKVQILLAAVRAQVLGAVLDAELFQRLLVRDHLLQLYKRFRLQSQEGRRNEERHLS